MHQVRAKLAWSRLHAVFQYFYMAFHGSSIISTVLAQNKVVGISHVFCQCSLPAPTLVVRSICAAVKVQMLRAS